MVLCRKPVSPWFIEGYILTKRFGQCHASSLPFFAPCNQASSVPNVLDCLYGPALKSCCEAIGMAPISLRVCTPDAAHGTRGAQLASVSYTHLTLPTKRI